MFSNKGGCYGAGYVTIDRLGNTSSREFFCDCLTCRSLIFAHQRKAKNNFEAKEILNELNADQLRPKLIAEIENAMIIIKEENRDMIMEMIRVEAEKKKRGRPKAKA